jgi:hypothetical protein
MSGPNFDQQEQFDAATVEAVTGTKRATLRQWETREVYICDLRRAAPGVLSTIQAPDWPDRLDRAKDVLQKYERGWRSYTLGDMVRIAYINAMMESGVDAREAGRAAMVLSLPEAWANSVPSGRELLRLQNPTDDPDTPDELVAFVPGLDLPFSNPYQFRYGAPSKEHGADIGMFGALHEWQTRFKPFLKLLRTSKRAAVILNLSDLRREVVARLEEFERGSEDGR